MKRPQEVRHDISLALGVESRMQPASPPAGEGVAMSFFVSEKKEERTRSLFVHASLKHYQFRQRLINKANDDDGNRVAIVPEQLTTKKAV